MSHFNTLLLVTDRSVAKIRSMLVAPMVVKLCIRRAKSCNCFEVDYVRSGCADTFQVSKVINLCAKFRMAFSIVRHMFGAVFYII